MHVQPSIAYTYVHQHTELYIQTYSYTTHTHMYNCWHTPAAHHQRVQSLRKTKVRGAWLSSIVIFLLLFLQIFSSLSGFRFCRMCASRAEKFVQEPICYHLDVHPSIRATFNIPFWILLPACISCQAHQWDGGGGRSDAAPDFQTFAPVLVLFISLPIQSHVWTICRSICPTQSWIICSFLHVFNLKIIGQFCASCQGWRTMGLQYACMIILF